MSQAAALFVTAQQYVDDATTYGARSYYLGMRDAFEAVYRACHSLDDDMTDVMPSARWLLAEMDETDRVTLITSAEAVLRARRAETVAKTMAAV